MASSRPAPRNQADRPVPVGPYTVAFGVTRVVDEESTVRYGSARYSVPHQLVGERVWDVDRGNQNHLSAIDAGRLLLSEGGPTSQQACADSLSLDPSNVVGLLNELEERQLITRRRDPADRRRHIVELSPRGEDELSLAYDRLRLIEDDLFSALSAAERATLYDLLVRAVSGRVASMRGCRWFR